MKDRASAALANLQRKAYAMSMLRSRIESRINFNLSSGGNADSTQEMNRLLDLVKNGEQILQEMSIKVESTRFLEEFVQIISGAAESVSEIREDVEELVPMAEAALSEMREIILHVSTIISPSSKEEIDPSILAQVSTELSIASNPHQVEHATDESEARSPSHLQERNEEELEEVAI